MQTWELELAAEDLRQASPDAWAKFMAALQLELANAFDRVLSAGNSDLIGLAVSDARAYHMMIKKLQKARETAARLKEKT